MKAASPRPADIVRRARETKGLTQQRFAAELGKSQAVLSRYEAGLVDPPGDVLMHCTHILTSPSLSLSPSSSPSPDGPTASTPAFGTAMAAVRDAMTALRVAIETLHRVAILNGDTALRDASHSPLPGDPSEP